MQLLPRPRRLPGARHRHEAEALAALLVEDDLGVGDEAVVAEEPGEVGVPEAEGDVGGVEAAGDVLALLPGQLLLLGAGGCGGGGREEV